MRILFTFAGGSGHFEPLVPVARAARAASHGVAFGCGPSMASIVAAAGFDVTPMGDRAASGPTPLPLRPFDAIREYEEFRDRFAGRAARDRAPLTLALCEAWRPDVIVCDETDFGAMIAAERLGLPYASVLVMATGAFVGASAVGPTLSALRARHALPVDAELEMLRRYLVLNPFPPGFRDQAHPLPPTGHSIHLELPRLSDDGALGGFRPIPSAPTVYLTLGTVFNLESGDLFSRALAGLRELPVNVIATVGREVDPAELGPQPGHIVVTQYIPQAVVLPRCDLVVAHGGSGSVLGALAHGRPMVIIPMGADQPDNAKRCVELGLGRALDPVAATPGTIRDAVAAVLADPGFRGAAEGMRDEIAALPGPTHAVALLERLALSRRPVFLDGSRQPAGG